MLCKPASTPDSARCRFVAIAIARCPPAREEKESSRWPTPRDRVPSIAIVRRRLLRTHLLGGSASETSPALTTAFISSRQIRAGARTAGQCLPDACSWAPVRLAAVRFHRAGDPPRALSQCPTKRNRGDRVRSQYRNSSPAEARRAWPPTLPLPQEQKSARLQIVADRANDESRC